jgi:hypothetical protein
MVQWLLAHQHGAHPPVPLAINSTVVRFQKFKQRGGHIIYVSHATGSDAAAREGGGEGSVTQLTWGHTALNRPLT